MTPPPPSITEDLLRAAVTPLDGAGGEDLLDDVAAHETAACERSPDVTRLVTRLVGAEGVIAYEWRELDTDGNVLRKAATVFTRSGSGRPSVRDFGADT